MEIGKRERYKKTELGWIPDEWEIVALKRIAFPVSRKNNSGEVTDVVSVTKYDGIVSSKSYFNKQVYSKDITTYKIIERGQFAYATIHLDEGSIGYLDVYEKAVLSPMYTVFDLKKEVIDKIYFFAQAKSHKMMNIYQHIGLGSINRRKSIPFNVFGNIKIPLPPLPEQRKIAEILTTVDEKTESIERQIEQIEQLKKGLMQHLFTQGIGHTEFKDTPFGRIPKEWKVKVLNFILTENIKNGYSPVCPQCGEGKYILTLESVGPNGLDTSKCKYAPLDDHKVDNYLLNTGDFLVSRSNTRDRVGFSALYIGESGKFSYPDLLMKFRVDSNVVVNGYFAKYLYSAVALKYLQGSASGTSASMVKINKRILEKLPVVLPPLPEQRQIASILTTSDEKLKVMRTKKSQYSTLKKGLMQKLLTGQIRVKV